MPLLITHNELVQLIGQSTLIKAGRKNAPPRRWLAAWTRTVESAEWWNLDQVRVQYPSADGVRLTSGTVITVFNVKGNEYRLLTAIDYGMQTVAALEVVTHAEYDKNLWKQRY